MINWGNLVILIACWTLWVTGDSSQISVAALVGKQLAPDRSWATLPMFTQFIGAAIATIPASLLMKYVSRRVGFMCGALLAILGAGLCMYAITTRGLNLYIAGTLIIGMFLAFVQLYRFAAAELAPMELRTKAISYVLVGGALGGLLGPQLANVAGAHFKDPTVVEQTTDHSATDQLAMQHSGMDMSQMQHGGAVDILQFRGAYVVYLAVGVLTLLAMLSLKMGKPPAQMTPGPVRSLGEIARQPVFIVGALSAIGSFAVMAEFMAGMTYMAEAMGNSHGTSTWALSGHYFAMYLPALFVGLLALRFGAARIILAGGAMYVAGFLAAYFGDMMNKVDMWTFMILMGAGWSFMFIGGTALVTRSYKPLERPKAQGMHDFLLFSVVALAALSSGWLFEKIGWNNMVLVGLAGTAVIMTVTGWFVYAQATLAPAKA